MTTLEQRAQSIQLLISDVDGVLTDGCLYYLDDGSQMKAFNVQDGMGLKLLMHAGIEVAVITASTTALIDKRMQSLGIKHYYKGQISKLAAFHEISARLNIKAENIAYIGDDVPDLPVMRQVGLSIAVANAVPHVREHADMVTQLPGGQGAVREACEFIMAAQNNGEEALERYLNHG